MEFPELGEQCSEPSCQRLDFLPFTCDACKKIFCKDHFKYDAHKCPLAHLKDHKVPICPLCNEPVACKRGQSPDEVVSQHIDVECQDDRARKNRNAVFKNKCSVKGCKQKELMPLTCDICKQNHCLRHRHPADHSCTKTPVRPFSSNAAQAALKRAQNSTLSGGISKTRPPNGVLASANHMTEDQALQRALALSLSENSPNVQQLSEKELQEQEDKMLAEAIANSQREYNRNKDKCLIS